MNCILTNKETIDKMKGFPLHREARPLLNEVLETHNQRISDAFVEAHNGKGMTEEALRKLSPKVSKHYLLGLIDQREADVMESVGKVVGVAESGPEETNESDTTTMYLG